MDNLSDQRNKLAHLIDRQKSRHLPVPRLAHQYRIRGRCFKHIVDGIIQDDIKLHQILCIAQNDIFRWKFWKCRKDLFCTNPHKRWSYCSNEINIRNFHQTMHCFFVFLRNLLACIEFFVLVKFLDDTCTSTVFPGINLLKPKWRIDMIFFICHGNCDTVKRCCYIIPVQSDLRS